MANKLRQFVQGSQKSWLLLVQATVWIAAVIATFLVAPPVGTAAENQLWVRFGQFVITIFVGLLALVSFRWNRKKDTLPWAASATAFLILGTVAFFSYQILSLRWTADYSGDRVVVGSTFTQEAADYLKAHPTLTNADLINHYTGKIQKIWTRQSIDMRRILLAGIYVLTMPLFAICIISLLQAIHCATIEKPRKRRREPPAVAVT